MRLLDRILANGIYSRGVNLTNGPIIDNLRRAQLVVIDNVASYFYQTLFQSGESGVDIKATRFPNVMLPFKTAFLEMRIRIGDGWLSQTSFDETGLLLSMLEAEEFRKDLHKIYSQKQIRGYAHIFANPKATWFLYGLLFLGYRSQRKVVHFANFVISVDAEGRLLDQSENSWVCASLIGGEDTDFENTEEVLKNMTLLSIPPALLAISFMHCRNVTVLTETPPKPLSKKHERKTGRPLLRYRVLQIDHMKQVLEREGGISQNGLKKALHICRGHFARYGQEGKGLLFGKHSATVWVPMHSRGSAQEGVVVKDYEVK